MTPQAYESRRVNFVAQDGSSEFISSLAFICADGTAGPMRVPTERHDCYGSAQLGLFSDLLGLSVCLAY
jgi:hypothetical protein